MFDISFEINGRKVRPNQLANTLEQAVFKNVADSVAKSLRHVRCPVHHDRPKVKCVGRNIQNLKFEISGCCQDLIDQATRKLH